MLNGIQKNASSAFHEILKSPVLFVLLLVVHLFCYYKNVGQSWRCSWSGTSKGSYLILVVESSQVYFNKIHT